MLKVFEVHRLDCTTNIQEKVEVLAESRAEALEQAKPGLKTENVCAYMVLEADGITHLQAPQLTKNQ